MKIFTKNIFRYLVVLFAIYVIFLAIAKLIFLYEYQFMSCVSQCLNNGDDLTTCEYGVCSDL